MAPFLWVLVCIISRVAARGADGKSVTVANPIRKVVNLLQAMQRKVTQDAETEKELYEKFMCYCKSVGSELQNSVGDSESSALQSDLAAAEGKKADLQEQFKQAQADLATAKKTLLEATALRKKEAAEYEEEKAESESNIEVITKAMTAIEKGMAGTFLQTSAALSLRKLVTAAQGMMEEDRQGILSFLSGSQSDGYVPKSGKVLQILQALKNQYSKSLEDAAKTESDAIESYQALAAAKNKEIKALTASIEALTERIGDLSVSIVQMKDDVSASEESLMENQKYLRDLKAGCGTKTKEWEQRVKTRGQEMQALADTIKILNDDDALELFKKTVPTTSSSFIQVRERNRAKADHALKLIEQSMKKDDIKHPQLDLIALALNGKKIGFGKVITMIDEMVKTLEKEQVDDDSKKEYCQQQFDFADDKQKENKRQLSDTETAMESIKESIATLQDEIKSLKNGIKSMDKAVATATEQRKAEHEEYTKSMASNSAAKELLQVAKNRLNKFYNPALYTPPEKTEEEEAEEQTAQGPAMLMQIVSHFNKKDAPPPPPATFEAYAKKSSESQGVLQMIDTLVKDLDKEIMEAEVEEKDAQEDYEKMIKDSSEKKAIDIKSKAAKESDLADIQEELEEHKDTKRSDTKNFMATAEYINQLHGECDWLLKYFSVRKDARAAEIDSLVKAKAVLNGAEFSLIQTAQGHFLKPRW